MAVYVADLEASAKREADTVAKCLAMGMNERQADWFRRLPKALDFIVPQADGTFLTEINTLTVVVGLDGKHVYTGVQQVYTVIMPDGSTKNAQHESAAKAAQMVGGVSATLALTQPEPNTNPYCESGNKPGCTCDRCF